MSPVFPGIGGESVPIPKGLQQGLAVFGGRYILQTELGRGGMGVVWLAEDVQLERKVALKFLPEDVARDVVAMAELKRETKRCLELTHPNIVRVFDWHEENGLAAISMEYIDGPTLSTLRLQRKDWIFADWEIRSWLKATCDALEYAHTQGRVVHRDLKPANIMVNSAGVLKICDFGISRSLGESRSRISGGAISGSAGSPPYMSPQHMMGEPPKRTDDVYGLGAMIYELFTGKPPFYAGQISAQIENVVPPSMAGRRLELGIDNAQPIAPEWEDVVASCLAKDPAKRPQSALEVWHRVSGTHRGTTGTLPQVPANPPAIPPPTRANRKAWLAVAAMLVAGAAGLAVFLIVRSNNLQAAKMEKLGGEVKQAIEAGSLARAEGILAKMRELDKDSPVVGALSGRLDAKKILQEEERRRTNDLINLKNDIIGDINAKNWKDAESKCRRLPKDDPKYQELNGYIQAGLRRVEAEQIKRDKDFNALLAIARKAINQRDLAAADNALAEAAKLSPKGAGLDAVRQLLEVARLEPKPGERMEIMLAQGVPMAFRWCPPGSFVMGSPENEVARMPKNETQHQVTLSRGFWMAETEVTQEQWRAVMQTGLLEQTQLALRDHPALCKKTENQTIPPEIKKSDTNGLMNYYDSDHPPPQVFKYFQMLTETVPNARDYMGVEDPRTAMYYVNWDEAGAFCRRTGIQGKHEVRTQKGWTMTLPSEAQWEYACRAGTEGMSYIGDFKILGSHNAPDLDRLAWYAGNSSHGYTGQGWSTAELQDKQYPGAIAGPRRVGMKEANNWGLRDMLGNVYEWCLDYAGEFTTTPATDPVLAAPGMPDQHSRIQRGGAWLIKAENCRAALRNYGLPNERKRIVGFRPALVLNPP